MTKLNCSCPKSKLPKSQILNRLHKESNLTWKQLANIFDVGERTIRRHAKSSTKPKQKRGVKDRITDDALKFLLSFTDYESKYNTLTQKEMATKIYQEKGILVSRQTIGRILKKNKRTRKKVTYQPCEQKFDKIQQFRRETRDLPLTQFSALDECSFHLNEIPHFAYSPTDQRALVLKPNKKGDNHTLIICVQRREERWVIFHEVITGSVNTQIFHDFLNKVEPSTQRSRLLLDNVSFHHAYKRRKKLKLPSVVEQLREKNMIADYLPSHTPMLNPTELIINTLRHNIEKCRSWTSQELKEAIDKEIEELNKQDLTPYFQHALTHFDGKITIFIISKINMIILSGNFSKIKIFISH